MFGVRMRSIREQIYRSESIEGNVNTCFRATDESFSSHSSFNLDSLNITKYNNRAITLAAAASHQLISTKPPFCTEMFYRVFGY